MYKMCFIVVIYLTAYDDDDLNRNNVHRNCLFDRPISPERRNFHTHGHSQSIKLQLIISYLSLVALRF